MSKILTNYIFSGFINSLLVNNLIFFFVFMVRKLKSNMQMLKIFGKYVFFLKIDHILLNSHSEKVIYL